MEFMARLAAIIAPAGGPTGGLFDDAGPERW